MYKARGNAETHNKRGNDAVLLGQLRQAIEEFDEAIRLNPEFAEAYYNRGNALSSLKQFQQAIKDYDEVIRLNPEFSEAYNNRGLTRYYLGQSQCQNMRVVLLRNPTVPL